MTSDALSRNERHLCDEVYVEKHPQFAVKEFNVKNLCQNNIDHSHSYAVSLDDKTFSDYKAFITLVMGLGYKALHAAQEKDCLCAHAVKYLKGEITDPLVKKNFPCSLKV